MSLIYTKFHTKCKEDNEIVHILSSDILAEMCLGKNTNYENFLLYITYNVNAA